MSDRIRVIELFRPRPLTTHFPRYLDALQYAQDRAPVSGAIRIERIDNGKLLSERRDDGRWYNAAGDRLPSPPRRDEVLAVDPVAVVEPTPPQKGRRA